MSEHEQQPTDVGMGLPEDAPAGMGMDPSEHAENDATGDESSQPRTSKDGDPGQATGNPNAAGADEGSGDGGA